MLNKYSLSIRYIKYTMVVIALVTAIIKCRLEYQSVKPIEAPAKLDKCLDLHKSCVKKVEALESCGHFRDYYIDLCENFLRICRESK